MPCIPPEHVLPTHCRPYAPSWPRATDTEPLTPTRCAAGPPPSVVNRNAPSVPHQQVKHYRIERDRNLDQQSGHHRGGLGNCAQQDAGQTGASAPRSRLVLRI